MVHTAVSCGTAGTCGTYCMYSTAGTCSIAGTCGTTGIGKHLFNKCFLVFQGNCLSTE